MHVVVLGSGGAASSIVDALVESGASSVAVHARNHEQVEDLSGRYTNVFATCSSTVQWT